jgi:hypothetical protein
MKQLLLIFGTITIAYFLFKAIAGPTCSEAQENLAEATAYQDRRFKEGDLAKYQWATEEVRKEERKVREVCR